MATMTPEEKQILDRARLYIRQKEYEKARRLLERIPFNPTAEKWLAKLEQVAPPSAQSAESEQGNAPLRERALPPDAHPKYKRPNDPPNDPMQQMAFFGIGSAVVIAWNWRSLGRPDLMTDSYLGQLILVVVLFCNLIFVGVTTTNEDYSALRLPAFALLLMVGVAQMFYPYFLQMMQREGYRHYLAKKADLNALATYHYPWLTGFMVYFGVVTALASVIVILAQTDLQSLVNFDQEKLYDINGIQFETIGAWREENPHDCNNSVALCLISVNRGNSRFSVARINDTFGVSLPDYHAGVYRNLALNYETDHQKEEQRQINNTTAICTEFYANENDNPEAYIYFYMCHLSVGGDYYQVMARSGAFTREGSRELYYDLRDEFETMINTVIITREQGV